MKLLRLPLLLLGVFAADAAAEIVQNWQFNDRGQVPLTRVINRVRGGASWNADFDKSTTNSKGLFIIKRGTTGPTNSYAEIKPLEGDNAIPHWLVVKVSGWRFAGTRKNETIRFGFSTNNPETRPNVVVNFKINNNDSDLGTLSVEALGSGAETSAPIEGFPNPYPIATIFALKLDPVANTYELWLTRTDGATWAKVGEGKTSPSRVARYLRFSATGAFSLRDEGFYIDYIVLQTNSPIPASED